MKGDKVELRYDYFARSYAAYVTRGTVRPSEVLRVEFDISPEFAVSESPEVVQKIMGDLCYTAASAAIEARKKETP